MAASPHARGTRIREVFPCKIPGKIAVTNLEIASLRALDWTFALCVMFYPPHNARG